MASVLPLVSKIQYELRGVPDHFPVCPNFKGSSHPSIVTEVGSRFKSFQENRCYMIYQRVKWASPFQTLLLEVDIDLDANGDQVIQDGGYGSAN